LASLREKIQAKLPSRPELWPVFSILLFMVCGWGLYRAFWYVPSWLEYLSIWSILIIFTYVLAFGLFESLVLLVLPLLFSLILPKRFFRDQFVIQGSALALALCFGAYLVQRQVGVLYKLENWQLSLYPLLALLGLLALSLILAVVFERVKFLARLMRIFADRMTIFGYLFTTLGLVGLAIVVLRNLL
jgi:hypothetical protein